MKAATAPVYTDIRDAFFEALYELALADRNLMLLVADQGALTFEKFKKEIPQQFMNVGICEQNLIGLAAGLALKGKTVVAHAIIPFITMRCYEQIRVDLCCMDLPVILVGVGAGYAYNTDGPTHHAVTDIAILRSLPGMQVWNPSDHGMISALVPHLCARPGPKYFRLDKGAFPPIYDDRDHDFTEGLCTLKPGRDVMIVASGLMVHEALKAAEALASRGVDAGVADLYRIKPLNEPRLLELFASTKRIVTLEEHSIISGIGSALAEFSIDHGLTVPIKRLALADRFRFELGSREEIQALDGLDAAAIAKTVLAWRS